MATQNNDFKVKNGLDVAGNIKTTSTISASALGGSLLTSTAPAINGTAAAGTATVPARADHVHPTDTSRAASTHTHTSSQVPVVDRTSSSVSLTLDSTHAGDLVEIDSASNLTVTIPADATTNFTVGTKIDVLRAGSGEVTIAGATSPATVTVDSEGGKLRINARWQAVTLVKRNTNSWVAIGALKT